jgi:hypothetical protein
MTYKSYFSDVLRGTCHNQYQLWNSVDHLLMKGKLKNQRGTRNLPKP